MCVCVACDVCYIHVACVAVKHVSLPFRFRFLFLGLNLSSSRYCDRPRVDSVPSSPVAPGVMSGAKVGRPGVCAVIGMEWLCVDRARVCCDRNGVVVC